MKLKIVSLKKSRYPICPECGKRTIVLFTPPKCDSNGIPYFSKIGTPEYTDWERAHLYCCNADSNCSYDTFLYQLTTPLMERP